MIEEAVVSAMLPCGNVSGSEHGSARYIGEEAQCGLRRAGSHIDQRKRGLPAVAAGCQVRDASTIGSDISQGRNGSERVVGRRKTEAQHANLSARRSIEFDGAAYAGRDRKSVRQIGENERCVAVARQARYWLPGC